MIKMSNLSLKAKFWLELNSKCSIGLGKIELLKKIQKLGSISKAAKEMGMSYKHAWQMVEEMNSCFSSPLVVKKKGGLQGGGTTLTEKGKKLLEFFSNLDSELSSFLKQKEKELKRIFE